MPKQSLSNEVKNFRNQDVFHQPNQHYQMIYYINPPLLPPKWVHNIHPPTMCQPRQVQPISLVVPVLPICLLQGTRHGNAKPQNDNKLCLFLYHLQMTELLPLLTHNIASSGDAS